MGMMQVLIVVLNDLFFSALGFLAGLLFYRLTCRPERKCCKDE